jgi:hypothetical protein
MQVEWEKTALQELDITATDLSTECLIDMLTRIPNLRFLSAGQLNGFNDSVSTVMSHTPTCLHSKHACFFIKIRC